MKIEPTQQTYWDWRAAMNFILGGSGSGLVFVAAIAMSFGLSGQASILLGAIMIGTGLTCVWFEIGRPERFLNVLRNPHTSWMSREAWVAIVLLPFSFAVLGLDLTKSVLFLLIPAFGFLYCQARILCASCGVPSWRLAETRWLIVATGLAEGAALYLIVNNTFSPVANNTTVWMLACANGLLAARALYWWRWRGALEENAPRVSIEPIQRIATGFLAIGHLLPFVMLLTAWIAPAYASALILVACIPVVAAGWVLKYVLITSAAHTQGFSLEKTPARGGGRPGPGIRPGWN